MSTLRLEAVASRFEAISSHLNEHLSMFLKLHGIRTVARFLRPPPFKHKCVGRIWMVKTALAASSVVELWESLIKEPTEARWALYYGHIIS